jgi:hypothetical protein
MIAVAPAAASDLVACMSDFCNSFLISYIKRAPEGAP